MLNTLQGFIDHSIDQDGKMLKNRMIIEKWLKDIEFLKNKENEWF